MTQEEKARAYDEALERAQKATRAGSDVAMDIVQYIFPQLAESEDERIRKALICGLSEGLSEHNWQGFGGATIDECIAYLEKQKEPKPEWSESDKQNINLIISYLDSYIKERNDTYGADECKYLKYWLKSLRPQYHGDVTMTEAYKMGLEAGKASSWKPSEEQMDRLFSIVAALRKDYCDDMADFLANLYADLKKLGVKEEPDC